MAVPEYRLEFATAVPVALVQKALVIAPSGMAVPEYQLPFATAVTVALVQKALVILYFLELTWGP